MNKLPVIVIVDTNNQPEEIIIFRPTTTTTTTTATTATATTATSDSKKFKLNSTKSHTDQGTVSPRFFCEIFIRSFFKYRFRYNPINLEPRQLQFTILQSGFISDISKIYFLHWQFFH